MDQRVTHAAVTVNKRLGSVLAHIKEIQEKAPPKPKVRTHSEKMGYKPNGRRPGRPPRKQASTKITQDTVLEPKQPLISKKKFT